MTNMPLEERKQIHEQRVDELLAAGISPRSISKYDLDDPGLCQAEFDKFKDSAKLALRKSSCPHPKKS